MDNKFLKKVSEQVNKINKSVENYTKIGKIPALPSRAFVNLADYLFVRGYYEKSEELLNNAVDFASNSSDALLNMGMLKQAAGDFELAHQYYESAINKDKNNPKPICFLGNLYSVQEKYDEAISCYEKALKLKSDDPEAYLFWGLVLIKKLDYKGAREKLKLSVEHHLKDSRAIYMLASVEIELGLYDKALERLKFIIASTENNVGAYHNMAYVYFKKKDYDKAVECTQVAIKMPQVKVETFLLLGDIYSMMGDDEKAFLTYKQAEMRGFSSPFLDLAWGIILQKAKQYEQAIERYTKGLSINANDDELFARLARCYFEIGDYENSKVYMQKSLDAVGYNYLGMDVLSDLYIVERRFENAIDCLKICLKNAEAKSRTYLKIARCMKEIGDFACSNQNYEHSIEYDRKNIQTQIEYIKSLNAQEDYQASLKKLITLEKLAKDDLEVLSLLFIANYNIAKGNIYGYNGVKAISVADRIREKYPDSFCFKTEYIELTQNRG